MSIKDLSPPPAEPVDLAYAKSFLRVDGAAEDAVISDMITAARLRVERMIRAALITRRQLYRTDTLSDSGVYLNHGPITAVHDVRVIDVDGVEVDLWPADYRVDLRAVPARMCLRSPRRWQQFGAGAKYVEAEIDAGYGAAPADIPMPLRQAVLLLLAQSYEFRSRDASPPVPMMVDALLMPYRTLKL